jgi:hypothetical protein
LRAEVEREREMVVRERMERYGVEALEMETALKTLVRAGE